MKAKTIFLSLFLLLASMGLWAQEKYEYAYISHHCGTLRITLDKSEFIQEQVQLNKSENYCDNLKPFFAKVQELQEKGWEVVTLSSAHTTSSPFQYAYLRKKKS